MSKLHKRSVQEALNATVGGEWTVNSAGTAGSTGRDSRPRSTWGP